MHNPPGALLSTASAALAFILAGDSRVTLVSKVTGVRFTYRIQHLSTTAHAPHFVAVLEGSDNTKDYTFLGTIFERPQLERRRL